MVEVKKLSGELNAGGTLNAALTIPTGGSSAPSVQTVFQGTFTTGASGKEELTIPYTGTGYPIAACIIGEVDHESGEDVYTTGTEGSVMMWAMNKIYKDLEPDIWDDEGTFEGNNAAVMTVTKDGSAVGYVGDFRSQTRSFNENGASYASPVVCAVFSYENILSYVINNGRYGLAPNTTYRYIIAYSS